MADQWEIMLVSTTFSEENGVPFNSPTRKSIYRPKEFTEKP
jgi:hypothetical protein